MNRTTLTRRLPVVVAFSATSIMAAGIAFAAWTTTGTGSGQAAALDPADDNLGVVVSFPDDELYPTGAADVTVEIANPNPYAVTVTSVTDDSITVSGGQTATTCALAFADQIGLSIVVPANTAPADAVSTTFTDALSMGNASVDGCKGQTVELELSADGASS